MGFDIRKKKKNVKAEEFVKEMKDRHKKAKAALVKSQKEMKRQVERNRKETGIQSGRSSVDKYKELSDGVDHQNEESNKEVDGEVYWTLYSQENCIRKCSRIGVISIVKNTPGSKCKKNSEVLRAGKRAEEDTTTTY